MLHDVCNQFKTHVDLLGANVEQHVALSRHGMALGRAYLAKRMELFRTRFAEDMVPRIRSESDNTREPSLEATEIDGTINPREITAKRAHGRVALAVWLETNDQENCCACERREDRLRNHCHLLPVGCAHT